jgi:predicted alpha/beta-hydrolase family hydrolase
MPLLYYTRTLLTALGSDVLLVEYAYNRKPDFQALPDGERERWFLADVNAAGEAALTSRSYGEVTLVGKSLGTLAITHLLSKPQFVNSRAVWLTPLLRDERVRTQMRKATQNALLVVGTNDPHYDADFLTRLNALPQVKAIVLEGADHSLESEGDPLKSISLLEQVMHEMREFFARQ